MQYSIRINQVALADSGIDLDEAAILEYLFIYCNSKSDRVENNRIDVDGERYTWIDYGRIIEELPMLRVSSKGAISRRVQNLEEAGFIKRHTGSGHKVYFTVTEKAETAFTNRKATNSSGEKEEKEDAFRNRKASVHESKSRLFASENNSNTKDSCTKTNKNNAETSSADSEIQKSWIENDPMELDGFVRYCRASEQRHINIIGEYADEKDLDYETFGQWQQFLKRNLRPARRLSPFTDEQIANAMEKLDSDRAENDGYLTRWTLETVEKYLE